MLSFPPQRSLTRALVVLGQSQTNVPISERRPFNLPPSIGVTAQ
jgi:hypothetical protein